MAQVAFGKPVNATPPGLDGVVISFPFSILRIGRGALRDTVTQHKIRVSISGTLLTMWGFSRSNESNNVLVRTLFEYARQSVRTKLSDGTFMENEQIEVDTTSAPKRNPYDPSKIPNPEGVTIEITTDQNSNNVQEGASTLPKAFISYSWDSEAHRDWVRDLATRLRRDGVDVTLDQWDTAPGDQLAEFMERSVLDNDLVLIICTPQYKEKSDNRTGGVGYEGDIMTAEVLSKRNNRKFIPLLCRGSWEGAAPAWLSGKYYIDLRGIPYSEDRYGDLVATLLNKRPGPPPLGKPNKVERAKSPPSEPFKEPNDPSGPIKIVGIIADEVTTPRNDGTRGSVLYTIPFQLSQQPPQGWAEIFVQSWDHPLKYTSMHRPGIARVRGNKIILDGTTMEEVEQYHKETLKIAINMSNTRYDEIEAANERRRQIEEEGRREHEQNVRDAAKRIRFD